MVDGTGIVRPTEAPGKAWQQRASGSRAGAPPGAASGRRNGGQLHRSPLARRAEPARSYWLNNMLLATPLALLLTGLMSWIGVRATRCRSAPS